MAKVKGRADKGGGYTKVQELGIIRRQEEGFLALDMARILAIASLLFTGRLSFIPSKKSNKK